MRSVLEWTALLVVVLVICSLTTVTESVDPPVAKGDGKQGPSLPKAGPVAKQAPKNDEEEKNGKQGPSLPKAGPVAKQAPKKDEEEESKNIPSKIISKPDSKPAPKSDSKPAPKPVGKTVDEEKSQEVPAKQTGKTVPAKKTG